MIGEASLALLAGEVDRGPGRTPSWSLGRSIIAGDERGRPRRPSRKGWPSLSHSIGRGMPAVRQELALLVLKDGDTAEARRYVEGLRETPTVRGL